MKIRFLVKSSLVGMLGAMLISLLAGTCTALEPTGNDYLWLHVSGKSIKTSPAAKQPNSDFIPMGLAYVPGPGGGHSYDYKEYLNWFNAHHLNSFRLVVWFMTFDGHSQYASEADFMKKVDTYWDPIIQYAKTANVYAIIDDHEFINPPPPSPTGPSLSQTDPNGTATREKDGVTWTPATIAVWQKRWGMIAKKYADEPIVMAYELMNEPHDWGDNSEGLRNAMIGAIKEIRTYDKKHIILIPCDEWQHSRSLEPIWGNYLETKGNPDPEKNAVFAFHEYTHDNDPPDVEANIRSFMTKHNVPVLCTETGASRWDGHTFSFGEENRGYQKDLLQMFSRLNVGWQIWDITWGSNWPKMNGWNYQDLWVPVVQAHASPMPAPGALKGGP